MDQRRLGDGCVGWLVAVACVLLAQVCPTAFAAEPAPTLDAEVSPDVRAALERMGQSLGGVHSLRARFVKARYTPLLKEPLISRGRVRIRDERIRWDTVEPRASYTLIGSDHVKIFYPQDKRLEVYPRSERFKAFGVGPLPQMDRIIERFEVQVLDVPSRPGDQSAAPSTSSEPPSRISLRMIPKDQAVREHIAAIELVVDTQVGYIRELRLLGANETRTVYTFTDVELNPELPPHSLDLKLPPDVRVVRPYDHAQQ